MVVVVVVGGGGLIKMLYLPGLCLAVISVSLCSAKLFGPEVDGESDLFELFPAWMHHHPVDTQR